MEIITLCEEHTHFPQIINKNKQTKYVYKVIIFYLFFFLFFLTWKPNQRYYVHSVKNQFYLIARYTLVWFGCSERSVLFMTKHQTIIILYTYICIKPHIFFQSNKYNTAQALKNRRKYFTEFPWDDVRNWRK